MIILNAFNGFTVRAEQNVVVQFQGHGNDSHGFNPKPQTQVHLNPCPGLLKRFVNYSMDLSCVSSLL